jgi:hypothetical protein
VKLEQASKVKSWMPTRLTNGEGCTGREETRRGNAPSSATNKHLFRSTGVIMSGVPVGAQMEELDCTTSGWPFARTRVDPVSHVAVTQGPLAAMGGGSVQPATA